jgi:UDP-N-acetylmuramate dehydrogenase
MDIKHSFNVKPFTTFGVEVETAVFIEVHSVDDLKECRLKGLLSASNLLVMGGGSNLLFCKNYDGIILHPVMKGISIVEQSNDFVIIEAQSGEVWDDLVAFAVEHGYYGLENLSFIPGNVGASAVQNIGAYGVEVQSVIERVEAFDIEMGTIRYFTNEECLFAYRDSIFKHEFNGLCIVTSVRFKLSLTKKLNIEYKDVKAFFEQEQAIALQDVRNAIITIRKSKLPDPAVIGNAGSFFKNPVVSALKSEQLKKQFPSIVMYKLSDGTSKLAAGWLIDHAGWKGFRRGDAGVHPSQALVLVNYGNATGQEIRDLAFEIKDSIFEMFGVEIIPEVRII